jgi:RHS repeat-associated protein
MTVAAILRNDPAPVANLNRPPRFQRVKNIPTGGAQLRPASRDGQVFGPDGNRIAEYDEATGTLLRQYIWIGLRPIAVLEGTARTRFFTRVDYIGRPIYATNTSGVKQWTAKYLPFGGVQTTTGSPIALRFPGQWFQAETGLYQNWMRDYDPTTGRYIQADPLGLIDGASVYGYARQSPERYVDPRGEQGLTAGLAGVLASDTALPDPSDAAWPKWAGYAVLFGVAAIIDYCNSCPACAPYPIGTIGYQGPEIGVKGIDAGVPHYHLFIVQQIPSTCKCIWKEFTKQLSGNHHSLTPLGTVNLNGKGRPPAYP